MHEAGLSLTTQMAVHILAMNVVAPLLILLYRNTKRANRSIGGLAFAATVQIAALWAAHAPAVVDALHGSLTAMALIHAALFVTALWFWHEVLATAGDRQWRAILALLITAKLFCLLGALLVFAPHVFVAAISDQQAAGLLMLAVCPITYLLAAGVIARRWLLEIEARPAQPQS